LDAPQLVSFTSSRLDLGRNQTLNAPLFENIDNSRFFLSGGAQFSVAATSYSATGVGINQTLFSASGAGTLLDLSSLQSINDAWNDNHSGARFHAIEASIGGTVDLSNVQQITGPARSEDRLQIDANTMGLIRLALGTTVA